MAMAPPIITRKILLDNILLEKKVLHPGFADCAIKTLFRLIELDQCSTPDNLKMEILSICKNFHYAVRRFWQERRVKRDYYKMLKIHQVYFDTEILIQNLKEKPKNTIFLPLLQKLEKS